jgi:hypothetical protein
VDTTSDPNVIFLLRSCPGFTSGGNAGGDAVSSVANVDPSLELVFQSDRGDNSTVAYTSCVPNGRYEVNTLFNTAHGVFLEGFGDTGPSSNHVIDLDVEGQAALRFFAPAEAAADELGNPGGAGAVTDAGVIRTFEVDVTDGELNVDVFAQRGAASINGITWNRIGDASGDALVGAEINPCPGVATAVRPFVLVEINAADRADGTASGSGFDVTVMGTGTGIGTETEAVAIFCGDLANDGRGGNAVVNVINFEQDGGNAGRVGGDTNYPGLLDPDPNNFALLSEGWLELPAGDMIVVINSDDGFRAGRVGVRHDPRGRWRRQW